MTLIHSPSPSSNTSYTAASPKSHSTFAIIFTSSRPSPNSDTSMTLATTLVPTSAGARATSPDYLRTTRIWPRRDGGGSRCMITWWVRGGSVRAMMNRLRLHTTRKSLVGRSRTSSVRGARNVTVMTWQLRLPPLRHDVTTPRVHDTPQMQGGEGSDAPLPLAPPHISPHASLHFLR